MQIGPRIVPLSHTRSYKPYAYQTADRPAPQYQSCILILPLKWQVQCQAMLGFRYSAGKPIPVYHARALGLASSSRPAPDWRILCRSDGKGAHLRNISLVVWSSAESSICCAKPCVVSGIKSANGCETLRIVVRPLTFVRCSFARDMNASLLKKT